MEFIGEINLKRISIIYTIEHLQGDKRIRVQEVCPFPDPDTNTLNDVIERDFAVLRKKYDDAILRGYSFDYE